MTLMYRGDILRCLCCSAHSKLIYTKSGEGMSIELELTTSTDPAGLPWYLPPGVWITGDLSDLRILEDGGVELRGLFGFGVEPQARGNLLNEWHISGLLLNLFGSRVFAHP